MDALRSYLHQEDKTTNQFEVQHRLRSDDGKIGWVLSRGQISARQADGRPMKLDGVSVDISCQRAEFERLSEAHRKLRYHLENTPVATVEWDADFRVVAWSPSAEQKFGWKAEELMGRKPVEWRFIHEEDMELVRKAMSSLTDGTTRRSVCLNRNYTKDGKTLYIEWYSSVFWDEGSHQPSILSRALDVTDRENAVRALSQLAYAAAHDLQEPIRTTSNFAAMLAKRCGDQIDERGKEFLSFIREGSERMGNLVRSLLSYAQDSSAPLTIESVEMESVVRIAVNNLQTRIEETGASVQWGELPRVQGDETQLIRLMQNLLANAINYGHPNRRPDICIRVTPGDGQWICEVRDNGTGIEAKHQDEIFGLFKRGDGGEVRGSGIGLATCRQAVERHGGRIWVESIPDEGSSFFFTLPQTA